VTANSRWVRFLDRVSVPPSLRGRTAQLERETHGTVVVWIDGKRQRAPKKWLVEGSSTPTENQNGSPPSRTEERAATGFSTVGSAGAKASTGRSDKPQSTTNGSPTTSNSAMSRSSHSREHEEDSPISNREWNTLLDACCRAGVSNLHLRKVIAEAAGIPIGNVGVESLTRAQYRRAMNYLANYRGGEEST